MDMNQSASQVIIPEKAEKSRMVAVWNGRKEFQAALEQDGLAAVLILLRYEKVEVSFARQYGMNLPAAFPAAIGNFLSVEIVKNRQQDRGDRVSRPRFCGRIEFFSKIYRSHD
jgi:hypothetical protein